MVRYVGAVEESIKLRDESVVCQTELKNLGFQEASNLDLWKLFGKLKGIFFRVRDA